MKSGNNCEYGIVNNTEYYDKLPYYTPPSQREGGLVGYYLKHSVNFGMRSHGVGVHE